MSQPSEPHERDFKQLVDWIKRVLLPFERMKALLSANERLISVKGEILTPLLWDEAHETLYFAKLKSQEETFVATLTSFLRQKERLTFRERDLSKLIESLQANLGNSPLSREQQEILSTALRESFVLLSGGPGTGKTTTIVSLLRTLVALYENRTPLRIALCAPTGLAAMRLKDSLTRTLETPFMWQNKEVDALIPRDSQILHSLLRLGHRRPPKFDRSHPLPFDVVLVDESSMIDLPLMQTLLNALSSTAKLILVGDPNQLPPVDLGSPFKDLVSLSRTSESPLTPSLVELKENFRFRNERFLQELTEDVLAGQGEALLAKLKAIPAGVPIRYESPASPSTLLSSTLYPAFWQGSPEQAPSESLGKTVSRVLQKSPLYLNEEKKILSPIELAPFFTPLTRSILLSSQNIGTWGVHNLNALMTEEHRRQLRSLYHKASQPLMGVPVMVTRNRLDLGVVNGERGILFYPPSSCGGDAPSLRLLLSRRGLA